LIDGYPFPLTIIRTRYGGCYEGGAWAAFASDPGEIPYEVSGDDVECSIWWSLPEAEIVGRGSSPMEAIADQMRRAALARERGDAEGSGGS
jgi:hypothetical protein